MNILPTIEHIRSEGHTTLTAMAAELNRREIRTAVGGEWHMTSVARYLARAT